MNTFQHCSHDIHGQVLLVNFVPYYHSVSELCDKVRSCDRQELDKLLPVLQKRISKAARASTECIKVKDFVQAWWVALFCLWLVPGYPWFI